MDVYMCVSLSGRTVSIVSGHTHTPRERNRTERRSNVCVCSGFGAMREGEIGRLIRNKSIRIHTCRQTERGSNSAQHTKSRWKREREIVILEDMCLVCTRRFDVFIAVHSYVSKLERMPCNLRFGKCNRSFSEEWLCARQTLTAKQQSVKNRKCVLLALTNNSLFVSRARAHTHARLSSTNCPCPWSKWEN